MGSLVSSSSEDFDQWVFAIDRRRHVPHGKTDLLSDSSVRSDGNALTSCCVRRAASPSHTAVVHEILQRGPYASILGEGYAGLARRRADLGTFFAAQFSAGCTTNISGFDLRQAQPSKMNEAAHRVGLTFDSQRFL